MRFAWERKAAARHDWGKARVSRVMVWLVVCCACRLPAPNDGPLLWSMRSFIEDPAEKLLVAWRFVRSE